MLNVDEQTTVFDRTITNYCKKNYPKRGATKLMAVTSSNLYPFSNFMFEEESINDHSKGRRPTED